MKNNLQDLNNYLFEAIERVNDDSLDEEGLEIEVKRAETISKISEVIIRNAELQFKAIQHADEYGYTSGERAINRMLEG